MVHHQHRARGRAGPGQHHGAGGSVVQRHVPARGNLRHDVSEPGIRDRHRRIRMAGFRQKDGRSERHGRNRAHRRAHPICVCGKLAATDCLGAVAVSRMMSPFWFCPELMKDTGRVWRPSQRPVRRRGWERRSGHPGPSDKAPRMVQIVATGSGAMDDAGDAVCALDRSDLLRRAGQAKQPGREAREVCSAAPSPYRARDRR